MSGELTEARAALKDLGAHLQTRRDDSMIGWSVAHGELTVDVTPASIPSFVEFLKSDQNCRFSTLVDITAVDYPAREARFDVVYHFLSMYQNHRIRVKCAVREEELLPSITPAFPAANWFEREIYDMFGILFTGHPDLRRILTDYGFSRVPAAQGLPHNGLYRGAL